MAQLPSGNAAIIARGLAALHGGIAPVPWRVDIDDDPPSRLKKVANPSQQPYRIATDTNISISK